MSDEAVELLKRLISLESFSKKEDKTADVIEHWLTDRNLHPKRHLNNVYAIAENGPADGKTILLNSHHDTVKPSDGWVSDPFTPRRDGDKLLGLGSNDAGASAVSMLSVFAQLARRPSLPFNLIVAVTAEEEISGANGIEALLPLLPKIDLGIVGEPTEMKMAIAERGLMVLDVEVTGKTGHAARNEGENALYKAMEDISWIRNYQFEKTSDFLGPVSMNVTQIESGSQHNVVPDKCTFVVDVRLNEHYSHKDVVDTINEHISGKASPRSMRLKATGIDRNHSFVQHATGLGFDLFGSATMSDQALMPFDTVKIGPGKSERSHTPNEFILISEIEEGIEKYMQLLEGFAF